MRAAADTYIYASDVMHNVDAAKPTESKFIFFGQ